MEIILTRQFKDDIKFYKRRKKYLKIEADVQPAIEDLKNKQRQIKRLSIVVLRRDSR